MWLVGGVAVVLESDKEGRHPDKARGEEGRQGRVLNYSFDL